MTEFITRNYGNKEHEVIIKTDNHEHYIASQEFARKLIDHAKPVTDNNVGSKWIPVSERLPEEMKKVLIWSSCGFSEVAFWTGHRWEQTWEFEVIYSVTHWMPLPNPPKEEDK